MKPSRLKSLLAIYFVGVLGLYAVVFWSVRRLIAAGLPDFAIYYCAGNVVRLGLGHQLYDRDARFEVERQFAAAVPQFRGPLPWTHPSYEALLFAPFSGFSYLWAYVLWNALNLVLLAGTLFLLRPYLQHLASAASGLWVLATFAFFPVFFNLLEGQDAVVLLFLYAAAFVCMKQDRDAAAGVSLALGLFKFHLVLPFALLMLFQRRWKLLLGFMPTALLTALATIPVAGIRAFAAYPRYVFYWENLMAGKDRVPAGMPSLRGLAYVLLPGDSHVVLLSLASAVLLLVAAWCLRSAGSGKLLDLSFSLALVTTVLVSYHVVSYDLSVLLIPVLLLSNDLVVTGVRRWPSVLILVGIGLLFFAPLQLFLSLQRKEFAYMGLALLLWMAGIAGELSLSARE